MRRHELGGIDADGEANTLRAHDGCGIHADHTSLRIDQRSSGVSWIQRRIGLHYAVDQAARARTHRAPQGAYHTGRYGMLEAQRVTDRDHQLSDRELARTAQWDRRRRGAPANHGEIGIRIVAYEFSREVVALDRSYRDLCRTVHDVTVGEHEAVGRKHKSGTRAGGPTVLLPHLNMDDSGTDARYRPHYCLRVGIQQFGVGVRGRDEGVDRL